jgi:hypothetical protein
MLDPPPAIQLREMLEAPTAVTEVSIGAGGRACFGTINQELPGLYTAAAPTKFKPFISQIATFPSKFRQRRSDFPSPLKSAIS